MDADRLREIYAEMLPEAAVPPEDDATLRFLRRHLPDDRGAAVLDVGCGKGPYLRALAEAGYRDLLGIDLFDEVETGGRFRYRPDEIEHTGCDDGSVDALCCLSVIYYASDEQAAFREFARVLRPGGVLVMSAHTRWSLFTLERRLRRPEHLRGVRFRSARAYAGGLRDCGFEIVEIDGFPLLWGPGRRLQYVAGALEHRLFGREAKWLRGLRSRIGYHSLIAARRVAA